MKNCVECETWNGNIIFYVNRRIGEWEKFDFQQINFSFISVRSIGFHWRKRIKQSNIILGIRFNNLRLMCMCRLKGSSLFYQSIVFLTTRAFLGAIICVIKYFITCGNRTHDMKRNRRWKGSAVFKQFQNAAHIVR